MKQKTSITLSTKLVRELDRLAGRNGNRSQVIEQAVVFFLDARARQTRDARDRALLDRRADALNQEAEDVLGYQVET